MSKLKNRRIRHLIQILVSSFLFVFQYIPVCGPWMGLMVFPLVIYISSLLWAQPDFIAAHIGLLLFEERLMFGRTVTVAGLVLFIVALVQFTRRKEKVVTSGVYSVVRHPQYLGISVITLGITIMCIQFTGSIDDRVRFTWLIQMLGYILLATYEERYLLKEYKEEYHSYSQKVSFLFPIPRIPKIPEASSLNDVSVNHGTSSHTIPIKRGRGYQCPDTYNLRAITLEPQILLFLDVQNLFSTRISHQLGYHTRAMHLFFPVGLIPYRHRISLLASSEGCA